VKCVALATSSACPLAGACGSAGGASGTTFRRLRTARVPLLSLAVKTGRRVARPDEGIIFLSAFPHPASRFY
jgi:hypothetical protein